MFHRRRKIAYFVLEGLNALAASLFFNYLFFYMRAQFGFGNKENLLLTTLHGLIYMSFAALGGKVAQRRGYYFALAFGFALMGLAVAAGGLLTGPSGLLGRPSVPALAGLLALWTFGMCFTWPALEALVSERETPAGLQQMLGIYNLIWAGAAALAYFGGGALIEQFGWGALFWLPAALHLLQLAGLAWLQSGFGCPRFAEESDSPAGTTAGSAPRPLERAHSLAETKVFLRLAWVANPLAYIAMNALLPVIPQLSSQLGLSTMAAGFVCSVWFFARLGTFLGLWLWTGWHYRFGWLLAAYLGLIGSFALILLVPSLWVIVVGQLIFGLAVGLLYYSSLFYSMDLGDTKGEHGGLHEAAIGVGVLGGPAIGVTALQLFPNRPQAGTWAVSAALTLGLGLLLYLRRERR